MPISAAGGSVSATSLTAMLLNKQEESPSVTQKVNKTSRRSNFAVPYKLP